mgnify:CR=1 FL=1
MMDLLFNIEEQQAPDIEGLQYIPAFITKEEEHALIEAIDQSPWLTDLKRRVQHYGYKYDYKARTVTDDAYIGELPDWIASIAKRLQEQGVFKTIPDQAIVNEYEPGQGISAHVDCVPCFGETIASLTLGSGATMQFQSAGSDRKEELYLQERSLIVLSEAARYEWAHAILARKSDKVEGFKIERKRRVSITFRNMIL